jgi:hypothetical protein
MGALKIKLPGGFIVVGSGGGLSVQPSGSGPDDPPSNPTVWDDEFTADVIDPKWTPFGLFGHILNRGVLAINVLPGDNETWKGFTQNLPAPEAGDWFYAGKLVMPHFAVNYLCAFMSLHSPAQDRMFCFGPQFAGGRYGFSHFVNNAAGTFLGNYGPNMMGSVPAIVEWYVGIEKKGDVYTSYVSGDSVTWQATQSNNKFDNGHPTKIGVGLQRNGASPDFPWSANWHWFRRLR